MNLKHLSIVILLLSLLLPLFGQEREDEEDNDRESVRKIRKILNLEPLPEKKGEKRKEKSLVFVPIAFYAPETGTGLGASVVWFRERDRQVVDNFTFTGFGTQEKQAILMAQFDGDIFEKTRLKLLMQGKYFPESFYGIGNDTRSEDEESFLSMQYGGRIAVMYKLTHDWALGPAYRFFSSDIQERDDGGILVSGDIEGSDTYNISGVGFSTDWDTRDNIYFPTKGYIFSWDATGYHPALGSDYEFMQSSIDLRKYVSVIKKHILAMQVLMNNSYGEVPFLQLYKLGGLEMLRGFHQTRFRDRNYLAAQIEYRYPIYKSFGGAIFGAVGDVCDEMEQLSIRKVKSAAGLGVRYRLEKTNNLNLRFDFALNNIRRISGISSDDDTYYGIYVALMEAF